jgi:hypothetical protein
MAVERVNISVSDDCLPRLDDLVIRLETSGLRIEKVFAMTGVVSGTIDGDRIAALRRVEGVSAVERDRTVYPATATTHARPRRYPER